jgi:hypothetical protein
MGSRQWAVITRGSGRHFFAGSGAAIAACCVTHFRVQNVIQPKTASRSKKRQWAVGNGQWKIQLKGKFNDKATPLPFGTLYLDGAIGFLNKLFNE